MKHAVIVALGVVLGGLAVAAQQRSTTEQALDPKSLEAALAAKPDGADATRLAERIRTMFGGRDALLRGVAPKTDETKVAWALELPEPLPAGGFAPRVSRDTGNLSTTMMRVGNTTVYALVRHLSSRTAFTWHFEAGDRRFGGSQLEVWDRAIFPDTLRWLWRDYPRDSRAD